MAVWKKLASYKNTTGSNVAYIETPTFTINEFLRVEIIINKGSNCGADVVTFNGDTSSGLYASRMSEHGGDDDTYQTSANSLDYSKDGEDNEYIRMTIANKAGKEKLIEVEYVSRDGGEGTSSGDPNHPKRVEWASKWARTSGSGTGDSADQITKIKVACSPSITGYADGTEITVYGNEGVATPAVYPLIPNGSIFEESDTGKIYMWDGTSAWNEIT